MSILVFENVSVGSLPFLCSAHCLNLSAFCLIFQTHFSNIFEQFYGPFCSKLDFLGHWRSNLVKSLTFEARNSIAKKPGRNDSWDEKRHFQTVCRRLLRAIGGAAALKMTSINPKVALCLLFGFVCSFQSVFWLWKIGIIKWLNFIFWPAQLHSKALMKL